jgi:Amt family ammonium transporter
MKNLMDFSIGTPAFWIIGFGVMFGAGNGIFGWLDPFVMKDYSHILPDGVPVMAFLIFQTVFCATSATIVSGSMAERTKFSSYCIYSLCISLFIYPISGHWIWGGGWLSSLGFHDFAGSTAVHMVGGVCALIGAKMLGPRIGKYDKNGNPRAILGHDLAIAALGVFILWFCWFGFNGCSTVGFTGDDTILSASSIFVTTNLCAAVACCTTMIFTWLRYKKPDVSMTYNAALAGLVGITAGCDQVSPIGAAIMGVIFGIVIVLSVEFFDKVVKIDDPVGAISVHGVCGALGTILVGVFAVNGGLLYGGGFKFVGIQILGVLSVAIYVAIIITIVFTIIKKTIGLRVTPEEEIQGLDSTEHGLASSYADFFMPAVKGTTFSKDVSELIADADNVPVEKAVPVTKVSTVSSDVDKNKFTKIVMVIKQEKFEALKDAMNQIGVTGITVTQVLGAGMQKGNGEYYRGVPVDISLLPKVKVEVVVCKVPVETVVEAAKSALYTGHIGDGKIFIYDVENVIKIRTGEEGYDALQDEE